MRFVQIEMLPSGKALVDIDKLTHAVSEGDGSRLFLGACNSATSTPSGHRISAGGWPAVRMPRRSFRRLMAGWHSSGFDLGVARRRCRRRRTSRLRPHGHRGDRSRTTRTHSIRTRTARNGGRDLERRLPILCVSGSHAGTLTEQIVLRRDRLPQCDRVPFAGDRCATYLLGNVSWCPAPVVLFDLKRDGP